MTMDFSSETMEITRKWHRFLSNVARKGLSSYSPVSIKKKLHDKEGIKTFSYKGKNKIICHQ